MKVLNVCVVTAGHLSTCPRMLKAADALTEAGYRVRVVSASYMDWARQADMDVRRTRTWDWSVVCYDRETRPAAYIKTGVRSRAARIFCRVAGPRTAPLPVVAHAFGRAYSELWRVAASQPADLYYGGTTGGMAPTAQAARRVGVQFAVDLEDFYSSQTEDREGIFVHQMAERLEHSLLRDAAFLTAGSQPIADAYATKYGYHPIPINNTFRLPKDPPVLSTNLRHGLQLYWFSQSIGPNRGLEDAVRAMGMANIPGELHLRGRPTNGYMSTLRELAAHSASRLAIIQHDPAPPDEMVPLARGYDVGLALEQPSVLNRDLCLTNKAFTYMLAGLAMAMTDTQGQRSLAEDLGEAAVLYRPGDVETLAGRLKAWSVDRARLLRAKATAWEAARRRWHWDHELEKGALIRAVSSAIGSPSDL